MLPRTPEQRAELAAAGGYVVPERAVDAQSLVAFADVVVSAGGTMNREAVALGTPVWTTFEGRLGAVDERLIGEGRLRRLERPEDVTVVPARPRADRRPRACGATPTCSAACWSTASTASAMPRMPRMPRRIGPAAVLPVHRHSVPQVLVDAGLVALSYYLAYQLRFDGAVTPRYQDLLERTIAFAVIGSVCCFAIFGLYRHWMRYASRRDYMEVVQAVVIATLLLPAYVAIVRAQAPAHGRGLRLRQGADRRARAPRAARWACSWAAGASCVQSLYERPLRGFRARRDARSVLIVGAGDGGRLLLREILRNPDLGYRPVGFIDDDPRKLRARIDRGLRVLGHDDASSAACSTTWSPTRSSSPSPPRRARCAPGW